MAEDSGNGTYSTDTDEAAMHPMAMPLGQLIAYYDALNAQGFKWNADDDYDGMVVYAYKHLNKSQRDAVTKIFQDNNTKLAALIDHMPSPGPEPQPAPAPVVTSSTSVGGSSSPRGRSTLPSSALSEVQPV